MKNKPEGGEDFMGMDRRKFLRSMGWASAAFHMALPASGRQRDGQGGKTATTEGLVSRICRSTPGKPIAQEIRSWLVQTSGALRVMWRPRGQAEWQGSVSNWASDESRSASLRGVPDGGSLFRSELLAVDFCEALRLTVRLIPQVPTNGPSEVTVASPFDPHSWDRQFYPATPYLILKPHEKTTREYLADAADDTEVTDWPNEVYYPFGVLENTAGFLFWGAMDIGKFRVLTPNAVPQSIPCLSYAPHSLRQGQTLDFDVTLKWFPKPQFLYRDVLRWYLSSMENSDPLTKDWLQHWDRKPYARPLPAGILYGSHFPEGMGPIQDTPEGKLAWAQRMSRLDVSSLWYQFWKPWDETYPTKGSWRTEWELTTSAEEIRNDIGWLCRHGFRSFLYFRQFLNDHAVYDDRPPLRSWLGRNEKGQREAWDSNYSCADFGNDDFRKWYLEQLKPCIDFYQPAGVAWDMGWATPHSWQYSRANPRSSNSHGQLRVQAEVWKWLGQRHPEMRIIANEAAGTLTQLFSDAIMIESPVGKGELDFEASKALGTPIIAYAYPENIQFRGVSTGAYPYLALRYRAIGLFTKSNDYVIRLNSSAEMVAIAHSDLRADGQWGTLIVNLKQKFPTLTEVKSIDVKVIAGRSGNARLQVAYIRLSPDSKGSEAARSDQEDLHPTVLDRRNLNVWLRNTEWLRPAIEAGIRTPDDVVEFFVNDPGRAMGWVTVNRLAIAALYMRVLSYGGCLGGGAPLAEFPEMNAFSAQAMGTPLLVGSDEVLIRDFGNDDKALTVSAWAGGGKLLCALYNGGREETSASVIIAARALQSAGVRQLRNHQAHILDRSGHPVSGRGAEAKLSPDADLRIRSRLAPFEALLWRMPARSETPGPASQPDCPPEAELGESTSSCDLKNHSR